MARKLHTDSRPEGAPPGSLHPVVMRRLLEVILHECRISIMAAQEAKREWQEQSDTLWLDDVPKTGTLSGWMRNDREANEYDQKLRREGA